MKIVCCSECGRPLPSAVEKLLEPVALTPDQRRFVTILASRLGEWLPLETIIDRMYGDRIDGGPTYPSDVLAVYTSKAQPKLATVGLRLEAKHNGRGGGSWRRLVSLSSLPPKPVETK